MTPRQKIFGYVAAPIVALAVVFAPLGAVTDSLDETIGTKLGLKDNSLGAHVRQGMYDLMGQPNPDQANKPQAPKP